MLESPITRDPDTQVLHAECERCRATLYRIALPQVRDHDTAEDDGGAGRARSGDLTPFPISR